MDEKLTHLEMIQGVINRMAGNSFQLKGWSVVLVSALFALAAKDSNQIYIFLAYFPAIVFWVLDGYFLWQEKLYRKLYDSVRQVENSKIDFSMDTSAVVEKISPWNEVVISPTLSLFHGVIIGTIVIIMFVSRA